MALYVRDEEDTFTVRDADLEGVQDGDKETVYTLRPLTDRVRKEIVKRHTKPTFNKHTHRREDITDDEAIGDDILDHILIGWTHVIYKKSGLPVPVTRENKRVAIDPIRQGALFLLAGVNEAEEASKRREASFRVLA